MLLYKEVITLSLWMKSYGVTIHVEATEHRVCSYGTVYTHCKMALPFEPVDAVLIKIDLSIETREEGTKFDILSCTSYRSSAVLEPTSKLMPVLCWFHVHSSSILFFQTVSIRQRQRIRQV